MKAQSFWLQVLTELRNRGVKDVFIACVDGLKGFPEAIEAVFPQAQVQLCIMHLVRASLNYVSWTERKEVARDLKTVYRAATEQQARLCLEEFAAKWNGKYPTIAALWARQWERVIPFFHFLTRDFLYHRASLHPSQRSKFIHVLTAASRTPPWPAGRWECRDQHLSTE
jgi:transposase-like protein